eukprot:superscaffoldBa00004322_g18671
MKSTGSEGSYSLTTVDFKTFRVSWNQEIHHNREMWKAQAAKDLKEKAKTEAEEGGQEEKEAKEKKESGRTDDHPNTGQEEIKTDVEGQEEVENRQQQVEQQPKKEEGDNNPGGAAGSGPNFIDNKKPENHTDEQQQQQHQNDPQPDCPRIHYCKRPSYCASSYRLVRSKVTEMRPIDARGKARRLQRISLRRRK